MSLKREEELALKKNKGIIDIYPSYMMSLDELSFSYMAALTILRDKQPADSDNKLLLSGIIEGLVFLGVLKPLDIPEPPPELDKQDFLTLCGQVQRHSTFHKYNNARREQFREIAWKLRRYIYDNFEVIVKAPKKGRRTSPNGETVQNAASD